MTVPRHRTSASVQPEAGNPATRPGLASSTGFLLARIGGESRRLWTQALADLALTASHAAVQMALGTLGATSQHRLSGVDSRSAVPVIDQLEGRELLTRAHDPEDRRRFCLPR